MTVKTAQGLSSATLSPEAVKQLRTAYFLDFEIEVFANATKPIDLATPIWQRAMKSRKEWIERMIASGQTKARLKEVMREFYAADKRRTPWDFLSHIYNKPKRVKV